MSRALRASAEARHAAKEAAVVVEVVGTRGSAPRPAGTRMLVWDDGTAGTVGGGNLEWRAVATARTMLADTHCRPADDTFALGASLGQCCGGAVTLRYRMLDAASLATWPATPVVPELHVFGAGHVGRAVVHVLATLDVDVRWVDARRDEFPREPSPANVARVAVDDADDLEAVAAEVDAASPGAFFLVLTHRHDLDLAIVRRILARGDFAFAGLIGSTTKRRRFAQLLDAMGFDAARVARVACPIGIDGIAGKEPAHIAIAVAAQVLPLLEAAVAAPRRGRSVAR